MRVTWRTVSRAVDFASKLAGIAVPFVIFWLGSDFETKKANADHLASVHEQEANVQLVTWSRDTEYVRMLANPTDRPFAVAMITQLKRENAFPQDLQTVIDAMSQGRPGLETTQVAVQIQQAATGGAKPPRPGPPPPQRPISVYIQYTDAAQGCSVYKLEKALQAAGFVTPPAQHVADVPATTSVRFFSSATATVARKVADVANAQGLHSGVQDFTAQTTVPLRQIELWIGKNDAKTNAQFVVQDEKGNAITDENGNALLDENCRPFTVGVSAIG